MLQQFPSKNIKYRENVKHKSVSILQQLKFFFQCTICFNFFRRNTNRNFNFGLTYHAQLIFKFIVSVEKQFVTKIL